MYDVVFVMSTRFVDTAVTTILNGAWAIMFVLILANDYKPKQGTTGRYRKLQRSDWAWLLLAFGSVSLVVWGATPPTGGVLDAGAFRTTVGVILGLATAAVGALSAKTYRWGTNTAEAYPNGANPCPELPFVMLAFGVGNLFAIPIGGVATLVAGGRISPGTLLVACLSGLLIPCPGGILLRKANLATRSLTVNNLAYTQPLFSLLWLWMFTTITVGNVGLVVVGGAGVVTANMLSSVPRYRRQRSIVKGPS